MNNKNKNNLVMQKEYRPCVGLLIINRNKNIFIGKRADSTGAWQMPQGGIDDGETSEEAAQRELYEETGIRNFRIIEKMPKKLRYDLPEDIACKLWRGRYAGQEQIWFAVSFEGDDSEINLNAHDFVEFSEWKWTTPENFLQLAVGFKIQTYEKVLEYFKNYL